MDIQIFEKIRWKVFVLGLVYATQKLIKYGTIKTKIILWFVSASKTVKLDLKK